jgi:hypothetical protein
MKQTSNIQHRTPNIQWIGGRSHSALDVSAFSDK